MGSNYDDDDIAMMSDEAELVALRQRVEELEEALREVKESSIYPDPDLFSPLDGASGTK